MLSNQALSALLDIRDNIALAKEFTVDLTVETFAASRKDFYATTRALEIVSEAARRLPAEFREAHASLPWKNIMGIGNVLRHDYDNVVEHRVWATVQEYLDPVLAVVIAEIERNAS